MRAGEPGRLRRFPHAGKAEVHDLVGARAAAEVMRDDVRGLQVAMEDPALVRELQRRAERGHHLLHLGHRQRTVVDHSSRRLRPFSSSITRNGRPSAIEVVVEDRDDVRMTELRAGAALAKEPLTRAGIGPEVGPHDLHRDLVAEQRPARTKDRPHAAFGEGGDDLVAAVQHGPDSDHPMILTGLEAGAAPSGGSSGDHNKGNPGGDGNPPEDRRERQGLPFLRFGVDGTQIEHLLALRPTDAAKSECDETDHNQRDSKDSSSFPRVCKSCAQRSNPRMGFGPRPSDLESTAAPDPLSGWWHTRTGDR